MNLAHAIKTGEFVIEHAGEKHKLICFDVGIAPGGNLVNRALVEQTLNHAADFSAHNPLLANVSLRGVIKAQLHCFPVRSFSVIVLRII